MRRRISLLLAAVLAGTTLMLLGPAQPASAIQVCGGNGTATVTPGLLYPVLIGVLGQPAKDHDIDILIGKPNTIHNFTIQFSACAHVNTPPTLPTVTLNPIANGTLKGYCGHSSGTGTILGEAFAYVSAGTFLVLTGHVVGLASAIPIPVITPSCLHAEGPPAVNPSNPFRLAVAGANQFNVTGAGVGLNCLNTLTPSETLLRPVPQTLVLTNPGPGVHFDLGVHIYTMGTCAPSLNHLPK